MTRRVEVFVLGDSKSAQRAFTDMTKGARKAETSLERTSRKMASAGQTITRTITGPVALGVGATVKAFGDFDAKMVQSTSIMGDVDAAMRTNMADTAKQVAADLNISSADAAESYFFLASAGLDATQSVEAMPAVARFAKAGMFDLATATDLATDAQSALGLASDDAAENLANMTRVTDVFAKANVLANTSIQQVSEAITNKAGAALRVMNKDVEEGVAVLAAFADQGLKGAAAGEALNIILRDVSRAAARAPDAFEELGIQVFDADGNMRNLADVVADLEGAFGDMDDATLATTLEQLGLTRAVGNNIKQLIGSSDAIRGYEEELRNAAGTTEEIADKQMTAFNEQLGQARQRIVNAAIDLGEKLAPAILSGAEAIASLVEGFTDLPAPIRNTIGVVGLLTAASGPAFIAGSKLLSTYGALADRLRRTTTVAAPAARGIEAIGAAGVNSSRGLSVLSTIFSPTGALVAGLAAAAAGMYLLKRRADAMREATDNAGEAASKLAESAGLAYEEIAAAATDAADAAGATEHEFAQANANAIRQLRELATEAARADYLVQVGWELTTHGATPEEAFEAIQRLADAAGITLPVRLEADDFTDLERQIEAIAGTAQQVAQQILDSSGNLSVTVQESLSGIASSAADAFKMGDVEAAVSMIRTVEAELANSSLTTEEQARAANHLSDEFAKLTEITGLSTTYGINGLESALRSLADESTSTAAGTQDLIDVFLETLEQTGSYEQALAALAEAQAAARSETEETTDAEGDQTDAMGDLEGAAGDTAGAIDGFGGAQADAGEETEETTSAIERQSDAMHEALDPVLAVARASQDYDDALAELRRTQQDSEATAKDLAAAKRDVASAALDLRGKLAGLVDENGNLKVSAEQARDRLKELNVPPAVIDQLLRDLGSARKELEAVDAADPNITITDNTWAVIQRLRNVAAEIRRTTGVRVVGPGGGGGIQLGRSHDGDVITDSMGGRTPGLKRNERLRILEVGEEVVTARDPRHIRNVERTHRQRPTAATAPAPAAPAMFDPATADVLGRAIARHMPSQQGGTTIEATFNGVDRDTADDMVAGLKKFAIVGR